MKRRTADEVPLEGNILPTTGTGLGWYIKAAFKHGRAFFAIPNEAGEWRRLRSGVCSSSRSLGGGLETPSIVLLPEELGDESREVSVVGLDVDDG